MPARSESGTRADRIGNAVASALDVLAIASSVLLTGLMTFLVIARYVLGLSVVGLHELIMLFAVALYMIGALIASRKREHLTVGFLADVITDPRKHAIHAALISALTVVVTIFFITWAYWMFWWGLQRPQTTPAYQIPLYVPQFAIMVAAVGCFSYALRDFLAAVRRLRAP